MEIQITEVLQRSTDQKKPNRERSTECILLPFHRRSSLLNPFLIRSVSIPYPFYTNSVSVLLCFCSVSIPPVFHPCSWNLFRRMRLSRTCLPAYLQRNSDTRLKLLPYVRIYVQTILSCKIQEEDGTATLRPVRESYFCYNTKQPVVCVRVIF